MDRLSIGELLAALENEKRLVRRPLSEREVSQIEREIGKPAPAGVRLWLMRVGLFQDLTHYGGSDFEVFDDAEDLVETIPYLEQLMGPAAAQMFPFGDDGAGDPIVVCGKEGEDVLVFVDHEIRTQKEMGSFNAWLRRVLEKALAGVRMDPPDVRKLWCVQFSIHASSERPIFDALTRVGLVNPLGAKWMEEGTSAAGVKSAKMDFEFSGQRYKLSRLEYPSWRTPLYSFNLRESAFLPPSESLIRKLDELFRHVISAEYKLVDYGPLPVRPRQLDDE